MIKRRERIGMSEKEGEEDQDERGGAGISTSD